MKLNKIFAAFMLIAAVAFTACEPQVPPTPGPGPGGNDTTVTEDPTDDPTTPSALDTAGWNIPAGALTVAQAREICAKLESGATTGTKYYVMGYVKKMHKDHESGISGYGNARFYMEDVKGANSYDDFMAFQVCGIDGKKISNPNAVAVGDFVVLYGELTKYQYDANSDPVYETVGKGAAYIWKSTNPLLAESSTGEAGGGNTGNNNGGSTGNGGTSIDSDIAVPADAVVFDADADQGTATTDYNQAGAYEVTKGDVKIAVTKGCLGTYNNEMHYRIYKNETLTITSTAGKIKEVVFVCTGNNGDKKWSPECFTVDGGEYVYSGANGQWKGDAATVTFTASVAQVRASQIAVVVE